MFYHWPISCKLNARIYSSPLRSPFLWVCRGILQVCRGDGAGWRHHQHSVLARGQLPSPRGPPGHHWTKLEGRCLGSVWVQARTSPPSVLPTVRQSSLSAVHQSSLLTVHLSSSDAANPSDAQRRYEVKSVSRCSLMPATVHSSEVMPASICGSEVKPAICREIQASVYHWLKSAGHGSLQPSAHSSASPSKAPARAPSNACSSKAHSYDCSSSWSKSSHVLRSLFVSTGTYLFFRSCLVSWGPSEAGRLSCHGHGGHSQVAYFSGCLNRSCSWIHPWNGPGHHVKLKEGSWSYVWHSRGFRFQTLPWEVSCPQWIALRRLHIQR